MDFSIIDNSVAEGSPGEGVRNSPARIENGLTLTSVNLDANDVATR